LVLSAEWEEKKEEGDAAKAKLEAAVERSLAHATKLQEVPSHSLQFLQSPVLALHEPHSSRTCAQVQVRMQALMAELAAGREQLKKAEKEAKSKKKAALKEEKELESLQAQVAALKQEKADATAARTLARRFPPPPPPPPNMLIAARHARQGAQWRVEQRRPERRRRRCRMRHRSWPPRWLPFNLPSPRSRRQSKAVSSSSTLSTNRFDRYYTTIAAL
jgi:hypothetical protein